MAIIWDNATDSEAAVKFGIDLLSIRSALKKPHVRRFVREERMVLLARETARNPHALVRVRDESANGNAVTAAVRQLEEMAVVESRNTGSQVRQPGITIMLIGEQPKRHAGPVIEVTPNPAAKVGGPLIDITPAKDEEREP